MRGILRPRLGIGTLSLSCILLVESRGRSGFGESGGTLGLLRGAGGWVFQQTMLQRDRRGQRRGMGAAIAVNDLLLKLRGH